MAHGEGSHVHTPVPNTQITCFIVFFSDMATVPLPVFTEDADESVLTSLPAGERTSNALLFDLFLQNLVKVHDRELHLTPDECSQFVRILRARTRTDTPPFKFGEERSPPHVTLASRPTSHELTFRRRSSDSLKSQCSSVSTESQRRKVSHSQTTTPTSATQTADVTPQTDTTSDDAELHARAVPTWRCFVKALTTTHIVLTFVPAGYEHLLQIRRAHV